MSEAEEPKYATRMTLVTTKSDAEIAEDLRQRLLNALAPVADLLNEARASGLDLSFSAGTDRIGRVTFRPENITVVKHY